MGNLNRGKNIKRRGLCLLMCLAGLLAGCMGKKQRETIHIAVPYSDNVQDYDTNYYLGWLMDKTGVDIEVSVIRSKRGDEYLRALFSSEEDVDAVFFGADFTVTEEELVEFDQDIIELYGSNYGMSRSYGCGQVLWINKNWLEALGLTVPKTSDELYEVLLAFKENDPNGNGLSDEIPLLGSTQAYGFNPVVFIMNSFVYTDPYHSYHQRTNGTERLVVKSDGFRKGLAFVRRLYKDGLLDGRTFSESGSALAEMANSSADIVGAFTTDSIAGVIYPNNPEILSRYVHVPPLVGPKGACYALYREYEPSVGAVVCSRTKHYGAVKKVLDAMQSLEGSLIARYGEEGVDWEYAGKGDIGLYGSKAVVVTKNYLWNTRQNKHLGGIGPMQVPDEYLMGVTWNGVNSDTEYIDYRAKKRYEAYFPKEKPKAAYDRPLNAYVDRMVGKFVKGEREVMRETDWNDFCNTAAYLDAGGMRGQ